MVFGRTVPDLSLNAIANLGYAGVKFHKPAFVGDTLNASSKIIGLKENSNGKTGTVYVESVGKNQNDEIVLTYYRWLMMRKRNEGMIKSFQNSIPDLPEKVKTKDFNLIENFETASFFTLSLGVRYHVDNLSNAQRSRQIITEDQENAERISTEINFFDKDLNIKLFPDWEILPYEPFSPHQDLVSNRLLTLYEAIKGNLDGIILSAQTALMRLVPKDFVAGHPFF